MDLLCQQIFSSAALAQNQHGRIRLQDNPPRRLAAPRPPFSPCPALRLSAPALRFPARASSAKTRVHPAPAARRPAAPGPAVREKALLAPLPPSPPPRSGISPPALFAARISPRVRHLRSIWSSSLWVSKRKPHQEPR